MPTYFRAQRTLQNTQGQALAGAQLYVCSQPVTSGAGVIPPAPLATLYADGAGVTPLANPVLIDGQGNGFYYASAGLYTEIYVYQGMVIKTLPDQNNALSTVSNILLQSNGVTNTLQSKQNLYSSDATVIVTSDGAGNVDLQAPLTNVILQSNGATNTDQGKLNLHSADSTITIASDSVGGVNLQVNGPAIATQAAYMIGAGAFSPLSVATVVHGGMVPSPLAVNVTRFQTPFALNFNTVSINCSSNSGSGTDFVIGLYDRNKNLLWSSGPQHIANLASPDLSFSVPLLSVPPGVYYLAFSANNINMAAWASNPSAFSVDSGGSSGNVINQNSVTFGTAANAATSGPVLPSTLGTLTALGPTDNFTSPLAFFEFI